MKLDSKHSAKPAQPPPHSSATGQPSTLQSGHHSESAATRPVSNQGFSQSKAEAFRVEHSRPFTAAEQKALMNALPQDLANQVARHLASTGGALHLVQAIGPNGQKSFASFTALPPGEIIEVAQSQRSAGRSDLKSPLGTNSTVEIWQLPANSSNSQLSHLLRQYQPVISQLADILVQNLKQTLQPMHHGQTPEVTQSRGESPVLNYPINNTQGNRADAHWLVAIVKIDTPATSDKTPSGPHRSDLRIDMKVPPSSQNKASPNTEPTSAKTSASQAEVTLSQLTQLSKHQIDQLKNQWVEVAKVKVLSAEQSQQWLKQLPEKAQSQLQLDGAITGSGNQKLYHIQLKTSAGTIQLISASALAVGEQLQLKVSLPAQSLTNQSASVVLIQSLRQSSSPEATISAHNSANTNSLLANALRQYQPLKSAMQMLALQSHEAGKMQTLAANTSQRLSDASTQINQLIAPERGQSSTASSTPSHLKLAAQQLLLTQKEASANPAGQKANLTAPTSPNTIPSGDMKAVNLPASILTSGAPLNAKQIQQALQQAGQELEANLKKMTSLAAQPSATDTPKKLDIQRGLSEINRNIQLGIKEWIKDITGKSSVNAEHRSSTQSQAQLAARDQNANSRTKASNALSADPLSKLNQAINNDMKAWLIQNQVQLMQVIQNDPNGRPDQRQLMDGLLRVLFPKQAGFGTQPSDDGEPLLPRNLSVQPHLQKLFAQTLGQAEKQDDNQQLRQLLNLTQNLTRLQQDQVLNRNQQVQQPDSPDFQMSLPYLQDKTIQWCEIECEQHTPNSKEKKTKRGWHIILRFGQQQTHHQTNQQTNQQTPLQNPHSQSAFAVEANLIGNQLTLSLWSEQQTRLQQLNQHMELLKRKVQQAGFVCDQIQSKHGMPAKKQRQIQQGLVDVRT